MNNTRGIRRTTLSTRRCVAKMVINVSFLY
jgi:hypothetical protein